VIILFLCSKVGQSLIQMIINNMEEVALHTEENDRKIAEMERIQREVLAYLSRNLREILMRMDMRGMEGLEEIRLRAGKPLSVQNSKGDWFVDASGRLAANPGKAVIITQDELIKTLELISENSVYAYQDEIRNGFITLRGGHRVGITGKAVIDTGIIRNIKDISGLNLRIAREVPGCAGLLADYVISNQKEVYNTLILSPPQCGKTTMLRDLSRLLSDGIPEKGFRGVKVGIVDERSEIAACYRGVAQNAVGVRTDVLDGCPKGLGMSILLRAMSPQVIVTDEIGNRGDQEAIRQVINAGVKIITSAHGYNISELKTRQEVVTLLQERVFERFIVLSNRHGPGTLEEVIDGQTMTALYKGNGTLPMSPLEKEGKQCC
jgi:stage III sporulation protein AA